MEAALNLIQKDAPSLPVTLVQFVFRISPFRKCDKEIVLHTLVLSCVQREMKGPLNPKPSAFSFILMPAGFHTLLLSLEGDLFAFGCNTEGQLGLGHKNNQLEPAKVPWNGPQPVQVDWGLQHSLVLDAEGGVWEAGPSPSPLSSLIFHQVPELRSITLVAAGSAHSAALDTEGGLWVWTSKTDLSWACSLPQRLEGLPPLIKVACGFNFLVAEAEEGLWVLGDNSKGQLGLGHTKSALQPTLFQLVERSEGPLRCLAALSKGVILIDGQGSVFSAGENSLCQLGRPSGQVSKLQRIINIPPMLMVSCGFAHTLSLDENGRVWTWGFNNYGQLGRGCTGLQYQPAAVTSLKGIGALVAGASHSLAFPQEGGLLVFGHNRCGELGISHGETVLTPRRSSFEPLLPHHLIRSREKSARFL